MLPGHPALCGKTPLNPPRHLPAAVTSLEAVIPAEPLPLQCWFSPRDEKAAFAVRPRFRPDPHLLPSSCVAAGRDIKLAAVIKIVSRRSIKTRLPS